MLNPSPRRLFLLGLVLGLGGAWLASPAAASDESWIAESARPSAPKLELRDLQGKKYRLRDLQGKVVIVNFWATWCAPCLRELPAFSQVRGEYVDRGVEVIGAANETRAARKQVAEFVERLKLGFPVWIEASADHMVAFGLGEALPATAIVDRQGRVAARLSGETDAEHLRSLLDRVLQETAADASTQSAPAARP